MTIQVIVHVLVVLLAPPLMLGVINKTKAFFGGRVGPPLLQPYYDLIKLAQKGSVFSHTTSIIFRIGPVATLVTAIFAAMLIPLGDPASPISFAGDLILFTYLLAFGRFFVSLAALDTGSPFEGMGAAREVTFACLAEPVMFFGLLVLTKASLMQGGSTSLDLTSILGSAVSRDWSIAGAALLLVLVSWFIVLLVENSRITFDDPNTHLELTMVHEVMVLDHTGPAFGMILYGAAIKLFVFAALIVRLAAPVHTGVAVIDWSVFLIAVMLVAVAVGVVESVIARLRMPAIPGLLIGAGVLSAFGLVLVVSHT
jgi:formate hydrogenlyase subunit 4